MNTEPAQFVPYPDHEFCGSATPPPQLRAPILPGLRNQLYAASMPPKISQESEIAGIRPFEPRQSTVLRQSSFASLSIRDDLSETVSQYSVYNPSVNEPFVCDEADPLEKAMHAFLDSAGIFQINVKLQLQCENKSSVSVCRSERQSFFATRKSTSFFERRQRMMQSQKDSTAGSSTGNHSLTPSCVRPNNIAACGATFNTDMFGGSRDTFSSVPT